MTETDTTGTDTTVTREQYIERINALLPVLDEITDDRDWCSERHRYFSAVMPEYAYKSGAGGRDRAGADFTRVPDDTDYAARLNAMRRRILWYVKHETINVEMGDRVLTALSLPGVTSEQKPGERIRVHLDLDITVAPEPVEGRSASDNSYYARVWAEANMGRITVAALDASNDPAQYIPGSAVVAYVGAERVSNTVAIPEADVERPSYRG